MKQAETYRWFRGRGLVRSQLTLLAVSLGVTAFLWLVIGEFHLFSATIYTLVAGNLVTFLMLSARPWYVRGTSYNWVLYALVLVPASLVASVVGGVVNRLALRASLHSLWNWRNGDVPLAMLICCIVATVNAFFDLHRDRMQAANEKLANEVQQGRQELASHASELRAAFEIQSGLLPRTIPQIAGVEISCAWQPARTVSGDFFDVVVLDETTVGFCLADVSGKGLSAALITANLQAAFRAFASNEPSPARLCERLNRALCASLPTGRFVTLVYGVLDRKRMTLEYELAGHNPPMVLRGERTLALEGSGTVLGLFPEAEYADHRFALEPGDRIVLSTDGVTEAFNPEGEEFGEERMLAAARRGGASALGIRMEVMRAVTGFAQDQFHDDASLMVVRVL